MECQKGLFRGSIDPMNPNDPYQCVFFWGGRLNPVRVGNNVYTYADLTLKW